MHLGWLGGVVLGELHGQREEASIPVSVLLSRDVALPFHEVLAPTRVQQHAQPTSWGAQQAQHVPTSQTIMQHQAHTHPSSPCSGRAWKPKGLSFLHAFRSSASLALATLAIYCSFTVYYKACIWRADGRSKKADLTRSDWQYFVSHMCSSQQLPGSVAGSVAVGSLWQRLSWLGLPRQTGECLDTMRSDRVAVVGCWTLANPALNSARSL
jgi:hypothetical protein